MGLNMFSRLPAGTLRKCMQLKMWIPTFPLIGPFKCIIIWGSSSIASLDFAFLTWFHDLAHAERSSLVTQRYRTEKAPAATRMILRSDTITSAGVGLPRCFSKPNFRPAAAWVLVASCWKANSCNEKLYHRFSVCGSRLAVFDHFS